VECFRFGGKEQKAKSEKQKARKALDFQLSALSQVGLVTALGAMLPGNLCRRIVRFARVFKNWQVNGLRQ